MLIIIVCLLIGFFITIGLLVLKVNEDRGNHLRKYGENVSMYSEDVEIYLFAVGAIEETDILKSLENALDISSISQKKFRKTNLEDAVDWGRQIGK